MIASPPPARVVSLVPSLTETLFDLGAGHTVVGVTHFCIFPPGLDLLRVGGTKTPRIDVIRQLRPDLVHMNYEENLSRHAREIEQFAPVFVTEPKSVDDVEELIATLGGIHGREERAAKRIGDLREARRAMPARSFTFVCPIWKTPWMWCGADTYVSRLVEAAGGVNRLSSDRYPTIALDEVLALQPDVIFLPDEPYVFTEADAMTLRHETSAQIVGPFPGHLFTWHGTRTIEGLKFLHVILN